MDDELLMTFMKLRLGLLVIDLSQRFGVSATTVSRITTTFIKFIAIEFRNLIINPSRQDLIQPPCLPKSFQVFPYNKVRFIIDCTEFFIEAPKSFALQAATWSSYKHHNTIKYLVSVLPNGAFNFVSKGYSGKTSDKELVKCSEFLNVLLPGDKILADRGFLIREEVVLRHAELIMPPGKKGQSQMTSAQVAKTKKIANRRIVVEQAIRRLKTFRILQTEIPISSINLLDDCLIICCATSNLMVPIMK